jgi:hypothetical protein
MVSFLSARRDRGPPKIEVAAAETAGAAGTATPLVNNIMVGGLLYGSATAACNRYGFHVRKFFGPENREIKKGR